MSYLGVQGLKLGNNGLPNFDEAPLEVTLSAQSNVVLGCAVSVLVRDRGVLAKYMAIADPVDFAAEVSILVFVFVEPEGESTLTIIILLFTTIRLDGSGR